MERTTNFDYPQRASGISLELDSELDSIVGGVTVRRCPGVAGDCIPGDGPSPSRPGKLHLEGSRMDNPQGLKAPMRSKHKVSRFLKK